MTELGLPPPVAALAPFVAPLLLWFVTTAAAAAAAAASKHELAVEVLMRALFIILWVDNEVR